MLGSLKAGQSVSFQTNSFDFWNKIESEIRIKYLIVGQHNNLIKVNKKTLCINMCLNMLYVQH